VSKPDEATYVYRVRATSYSTLFDKDVAQTEVLDRFLAECTDPTYRRVAKLALLQRVGPPADLPARTVPDEQARLLADAGLRGELTGFADPDLGLVVRAGDRVAVVGDDPAGDRIVLAGPLRDGRVEAEIIEDETLRRDRSSLRDVLR